MNNDFFDALKILQKEKELNIYGLIEKIKNAIIVAIKKDYGNINNVLVDIDIDKNIFSIFIIKTAVEQVADPVNEILLEEAIKYDINAQVDTLIYIELNAKKFGRIAALSAKQVIKQGIRDAEKNRMYDEFKEKEHQIISAVVNKVDPKRENATLQISLFEIILSKPEQIPNELLTEGDIIKVYISGVTKTEKGPRILISRTHPNFVRKLFEIEVPEIISGIIEIKNIVREAGSRTKIAVISNNPAIDPVGSCVGNKGIRVNKVVNELSGEKIDIIKYSDDFMEFISNSLSPATINSVLLDPSSEKACYVIVPDDQLSLAIGNKGQNVRLSAKLTGWKIDIKPQSEAYEVQAKINLNQYDDYKNINCSIRGLENINEE